MCACSSRHDRSKQASEGEEEWRGGARHTAATTPAAPQDAIRVYLQLAATRWQCRGEGGVGPLHWRQARRLAPARAANRYRLKHTAGTANWRALFDGNSDPAGGDHAGASCTAPICEQAARERRLRRALATAESCAGRATAPNSAVDCSDSQVTGHRRPSAVTSETPDCPRERERTPPTLVGSFRHFNNC